MSTPAVRTARPERTADQPRPANAPSATRRFVRRLREANPLAGFGALIWLVIVGLPLYAMLVATFQPHNSYLSGGTLSLPTHPTLGNYRLVLDNDFLGYFVNTAIVTVVSVAIVLALAIPVSYAVIRSRSRLTRVVFRIFMLGLAIPAQATIVPLYLLISKLGLYDSLPGIILPAAAFSLPVCVLILTGSMRDISEEMYEAMALDGASPGRVLWQLVIPLSRAGVSTVAIFSALQAWNGFLFPLILTQSNGDRVLTLSLFDYQSQFGVNIPALLAAVVLSGVPIFVVYLVARKSLINGLMGVGGR